MSLRRLRIIKLLRPDCHHLQAFIHTERPLLRMDFSTESSKSAKHLDTHALPPNFIQDSHWHYNQVKKADLDSDLQIIDFEKGLSESQKCVVTCVDAIAASRVCEASTAYKKAFLNCEDTAEDAQDVQDVPIYEHSDFPGPYHIRYRSHQLTNNIGLRIIPGLLPPQIQMLFTSQILHRDLADPRHKNNMNADYNIPYPGSRRKPGFVTKTEEPSPIPEFKSFFTYPQNSIQGFSLMPKDPTNKPLNAAQFLVSKLRWLTIGDQYDWPTRSYGKHESSFPPDLTGLVQGLFPDIRPESGVILLYSGKDYMPVHRDVSEQCQNALASFSLGCDGIFIIARGEDSGEGENQPRTLAIRVRSGDCVHLDGEARWAWHAMARTISGTCPDFLKAWPSGTIGATSDEKRMYEKWKGYMNGKRLNISCRQVRS